MREGYVLVDYHNLHDSWSASFLGTSASRIVQAPRAKHQASIQHVIDLLLKKIADCLSAADSLPSQLTIRLYGGWYQNGDLTDHAGMVQQAIRNAPARLKLSNGSRILMEVATSLLDYQGHIIDNTVQVKSKLHKIEFCIPPERCAKPLDCELSPLQNDWREIPCIAPNCPVKLRNAVKASREQKCVDVHIACDLLSLARQQPRESVVCLATNDYDLFPAIRACALSSDHPRLLWAFSQPYERKPFLEFLDQSNIKVVSLA